MFKKILVATSLMSMFAGSAYSMVNGEVSFGRRYMEFKASGGHNGFHGWDTTVQVNVNPMPTIPLSLGLNYSYIMLDKKDFSISGTEPSSANINELGLNLTGWLTMVPVVTPYLRVRFPVMSNFAAKFDAGEFKAKNSGIYLNVGGLYKITPMFSAFVEFSYMLAGKAKFDDNSGGATQDLRSMGALIGVQAGI